MPGGREVFHPGNPCKERKSHHMCYSEADTTRTLVHREKNYRSRLQLLSKDLKVMDANHTRARESLRSQMRELYRKIEGVEKILEERGQIFSNK